MKQSNYLIKFILFMAVIGSVQAVPSDYVVMTWSEANGLVAEYHQVVDLPSNRFLKSDPASDHTLALLDEKGQVLANISLKDELITRSEFHGHHHIDGRAFLNEEVTFVVRVPQGLVKQIQLPFMTDKQSDMVDYQSLIDAAVKRGPQTVKTAKATIDNRINLLFMGDGYTNAQMNDFNTDVNNVISYMQTFEPYKSYAGFVSYDRLFTASAQSGADKPSPCFASPSFVNTAFDAKFCTSSIERLLTVNSTKIYTAAAANPDWDEITVIVNDDVYGGSGGAFSTISTNQFSDDIFVHEYGHSFTDLADEYTSPYPGFPACSDVSGSSPCEANVTDVTNRNNIKWNYLIIGATPVPTPDTAPYSQVVGLFEGARYLVNGMYRPQSNCNMNALGFDFCAVCQEAYVRKVYQVPYAGGGLISRIEPMTQEPANPSPDGMVSVMKQFSVDTLQPDHDLTVTWFVDGASQGSYSSSQVTQSFQYTPSSTGIKQIKVRVKDNSALVDGSQHGSLPQFEHVWQFNVMPAVDLIFENGFE